MLNPPACVADTYLHSVPSHKISVGAIVGGVLGGLAGVLGLGLCLFFARRRSQSRGLAVLEKDDMFVKDPDEADENLSIIPQLVRLLSLSK
jgi:hypothetical protein